MLNVSKTAQLKQKATFIDKIIDRISCDYPQKIIQGHLNITT